jgi:hypothetical protein
LHFASTFIICAILTYFGFRYVRRRSSLEKAARVVLPDLRVGLPEWQFTEPVINSTSPYSIGKTKPAGSNYTRCLVVASLKNEDTTWVNAHLVDLQDAGLLAPAVYVVDDSKAKFRVPKNKGHEAMVYLTYIIDHYDSLPDVSIFMHAERHTWHNDELLERDAVEMIQRLSPERVTRDGYMNLRCHWEPGCPSWLRPSIVSEDPGKAEQLVIAQYWRQLFPEDPLPEVLAQPCCAQFAVSRDRIHELPKERYTFLREWLLSTDLSDYLSGRVFEYTWQFIFTKSPVSCPSMSICYCDGYGICFGSPKEFDYWFELRYKRNEYVEAVRLWQRMLDHPPGMISLGGPGTRPLLGELANIPDREKIREAQKLVNRLTAEMDGLLAKAVVAGESPRQRALEAGREWRDGNGF